MKVVLAMSAFLALISTPVLATGSGFEYQGPAAPATINLTLVDMMSDTMVHPLFDEARKTNVGFLVVLRNNPCGGTSNSAAIGAATGIIESYGLRIAVTKAVLDSDGVTSIIMIEVYDSNNIDFLATASEPFPECFEFNIGPNKVTQLKECCGQWASCDGGGNPNNGDTPAGRCFSCGGKTVLGLCIPVVDPT